MLPSSKPEYPPLLDPGFHKMSLAELGTLCVDRFPASAIRRDMMNALESVIAQLESEGIKGELWVDGSFLTEDESPRDVDAVLQVSGDFWLQASQAQKDKLRWFESPQLKATYRCDCQKWIQWPQGHEYHGESELDRGYWTRQFGFSRELDYKGIAVLRVGGDS